MANPVTNMQEIGAAPVAPLPGTSLISPAWAVYKEASFNRDVLLTIAAMALTARAPAASAKQQLDAAISDAVKGGSTKLQAVMRAVANVCATLGSTVDNTLPTAGGDRAAPQAEEEEESMDALFESAIGMQQNDPGSNSVAAATVAMQQLSTAPRPPKQPRPQQARGVGNRPSESGNGAKGGRKLFTMGVRGNFPPQRGAPAANEGDGGGAMEVDSGPGYGQNGPPQAQQVCHTDMKWYEPNMHNHSYAPPNNRVAPGGHPRPRMAPAPPPRAPSATHPRAAPRASLWPKNIFLVTDLGWLTAMWPLYRGASTFVVTHMVMVCHLLYTVLGRVIAALSMNLDYWLHLSSQTPNAHVRCILYSIGGLYVLAGFAAPIAALSTPMISFVHNGVTSLMQSPSTSSLRSMTLILPACFFLQAVLRSHAAMSASLTKAPPPNNLKGDHPSTTLYTDSDANATRQNSECSRTRKNKYFPVASAYIGSKLSHLRLTGARRWGLSVHLCRQVRRQVWNLDHKRPPSSSMARLRDYLNKNHQKCPRPPIYRSWENSSRAPPPPCAMVGGANNKQKQSERELTAQLLARNHNLQPVHSYRFIVGDCFFDCMEYLTGVPSLIVRELAMLMWRHAMSKCTDTAVATAVHIATNQVGQGRSMNPEDYIIQMTKSAAVGGLWADSSAVTWAAAALNVTIHVYRLMPDNKEIEHRVYRAGGINGGAMPSAGDITHIHLLFTGPLDAGHYTPMVPLTPSPMAHKAPPRPTETTNSAIATLQALIATAGTAPIPEGRTLQLIALSLCNPASRSLRAETVTLLVRQLKFIFPQLQGSVHDSQLHETVTAMMGHLCDCEARGQNAERLLRQGTIMRPMAAVNPTGIQPLMAEAPSKLPWTSVGPRRRGTARRSEKCPAPKTLVPPMKQPLDTEAAARGGVEETNPGLIKSGDIPIVTALGQPVPQGARKKAKAAMKKKAKKNKQAAGYTQLTIEEAMQHVSQPGARKVLPPTEPVGPQASTEHLPDTPTHLIALLNVMGIHSHLAEVGSLWHNQRPTVMVGTEVKMRPGEQHCDGTVGAACYWQPLPYRSTLWAYFAVLYREGVHWGLIRS